MKKVLLNQKCYLNYLDIIKFEKEYSKISVPNLKLILFPQIAYLSIFNNKDYLVGCQNFNSYNNGSYTGEVSLESIRSMKINYILVSHPERKKLGLETYEISKEKLYKSLKASFKTTLFVGELTNKRNAFNYIKKELKYFLRDIESNNLKNLSICYCPYIALGESEKSLFEISNIINKIKVYILNKYDYDCEIYYGGYIDKDNIKDVINICDGVVINKESTNINELLDILSPLYDIK